MSPGKVAVTGLAGRFPGAADVEQFWGGLRNGTCSIRTLSADELLRNGVSYERIADPRYVRAAATLEGYDVFDAEAFGYSPREARTLDPQHRLFLQVCLHALEDACVVPREGGPVIGVFASAGGNVTSYASSHVAAWEALRGQTASVEHLATDKDFLAARVAYKLGLTGPTLTVQTSTSSSLVAVHLACRSLLDGECDIAIAGGSCIRVPHEVGYLHEDGGILSADGLCRPLDEHATGTVFGSGVAAVVLRRLEDARADEDRIRAIVLGSAIAQDGARKDSFTISSAEGVERVARLALERAGVDGRTIGLVEAHATGTVRGDPIEFAGLSAVYGDPSDRARCGVGSVKGNIGHLEAAAGIASFIKAVLALEQGWKPASVNLATPRAGLTVGASALSLLMEGRPWHEAGGPRRAAVSSLGLGGTNAHVILEESPAAESPPPDVRPCHILSISAVTEKALDEQIDRYVEFLRGHTNHRLADVAHSANVGRIGFDHRLTVVGDSVADVATLLEHGTPQSSDAADRFVESTRTGVVSRVSRRGPGRRAAPVVAFLFSGQSVQYLGMARQLFAAAPTFRALLTEYDLVATSRVGRSVVDIMFGSDEGELARPSVVGPAIFILQCALTRLLERWGVRPQAFMGHSLGEYAIAYSVGIMSFADALHLVAKRGELIETLEARGSMATVAAPEAVIRDALEAHRSAVGIAAHNGSEDWVISGDTGALDAVLVELEKHGRRVRRMAQGFAAHSHILDPILDEFERAAAGITYETSTARIASTLTGTLATGEDLRSARYWREHFRKMVRSAEALAKLQALGANIFVEVGPHPTILSSGYAAAIESGKGDECAWLPTLSRRRPAWQQMLETLGELHTRGVDIDWSAVDAASGYRKISVPQYAFRGERYNLLTDILSGAQTGQSAPERGISGAFPTMAAGRELRSPALRDVVFETRSGDSGLEVFGVPIASLGQFVELALDACGDGVLRDVGFVELLSGSVTEPRVVQTILRRAQGGARLEIYSTNDRRDQWTLHCYGSTARRAERRANKIDASAVRARAAEEQNGEDFYRQLVARGFKVAEGTLRVQRLWRGPGVAVAEIDTTQGSRSPTAIRAKLVEASSHAILALLQGSDNDAWLPIGFDELQTPARIPDIVLASVALRSERSDGETATADILLYDAGGEAIGALYGYCLRRIDREALLLRGHERSEWSYEIAWHAQELERATHPPPAGEWVVVGEPGAVTEALVEGLRSAGETVSVVGSPAEAAIATGAQLRGVISLLPVGVGVDTDLTDALARTCGSTIELAAALKSAVAEGEHPRLFIVTQGAQPVLGTLMNCKQAPAWGLGRTLAAEFPDLLCTCLDLDPHSGDAKTLPLVESVLHADQETQVAYRRGRRYVARLVRSAPSRRRLNLVKPPFKVKLRSPGVLENVVLEPMKRRMLGPKEVEIAARAYGVTFYDVLTVLGVDPGSAPDGGLGMECAGVVAAVGNDVKRVAIGDPVVALMTTGMASHVITSEELVVPMSRSMSFEQAAASPVAFVMAWHLLHDVAELRPGQSVLVHAAAGALGQAAVRVAQRLGAKAFATASHTKRDLVASLGVAGVFSSRTQAFGEQLLEKTEGEGVDVVVHSLPSRFLPTSASCLRPGGLLIDVSSARNDGHDLARDDIRYVGFSLHDMLCWDPARAGEALGTVMSALDRDQLERLSFKPYAITDLLTAYNRLLSPRHTGKVVISLGTPTLGSITAVGPAADPFSSYLVVGGGPEERTLVLEHLRGTGARHVIFLGGPPTPTEPFGDVTHTSVGLSDPESVAAAIRVAATGRPVIRGAFVLREAAPPAGTTTESWEQFEPEFVRRAAELEVLEAALDRLALTLDFFVLFSSTASVVGAPECGVEAAFSAFVDGLAHARRARGLPATVVNWGAWEAPGDSSEHWARGGAGVLRRDQGLRVLQASLADPPLQIAIMAVRWSIATQQQPALRELPFFNRILGDVGDRKRTAGAQQPRQELERAEPADRSDRLMEFIEGLVVKILGLHASRRLDPRAGFKDIGLDSLLALELRGALQDAFGLGLPQGVSFNYPNLEEMTRYLLNRLFPAAQAQTSAFAYETDDASLPQPLGDATAGATLESLDASAIERLLRSELETS